jgi:hypothetical protein
MVLEEHSKNRADNNAGKKGKIEEKLAKNYGLHPLLFVCGHDARSLFSAEGTDLDSLH